MFEADLPEFVLCRLPILGQNETLNLVCPHLDACRRSVIAHAHLMKALVEEELLRFVYQGKALFAQAGAKRETRGKARKRRLFQVGSPFSCDSSRISRFVRPVSLSGLSTPSSAIAWEPGR